MPEVFFGLVGVVEDEIEIGWRAQIVKYFCGFYDLLVGFGAVIVLAAGVFRAALDAEVRDREPRFPRLFRELFIHGFGVKIDHKREIDFFLVKDALAILLFNH